MITLSLRTIILACICVYLSNGFGVDTSFAQSPSRALFTSDTKLSLTVEAPLKSLFSEHRDSGEYVEGQVTIHRSDGSTQTVPMKIKTRGKSRRSKATCNFPPLRVNFPKSATAGTVFEGQDKLKLVTHCQSRKSRYDAYYVQEQTVYETYNVLTDQSFRTRLAQINYVDTEDKHSVEGKHGFFIEDIDHVADRVGLERLKTERLSIEDLDAVAAARFGLFQYLIGNLDWAFLGGPEGDDCCHNSKVLTGSNGKAIHVPYDFDHAGVVDTDYASVPDGISLSSTRQRLYRGLCAHNQQIPEIVELFNNKRSEIYQIIEQNQGLSKSRRDRTIAYYDKFYKTVNDQGRLEKSIYQKCRG